MTGKYDDLNKSQLIELLEKHDRTKKLGLVWERDEIDADKALDHDFIVAPIDEDLSDKPAPWDNLIIEGDNYDALRWLRMTHRGRVKCIYIDPPYNTGNKDWVYNDRYMSADDRFRQSTWLEFLYRRLTLARDLLAEDGVILISINDEQRALLELMADEALPGMRIGSFVWRTKDSSNDAEHNFSGVHEHVIVFGKPAFDFLGYLLDDSKYRNSDNDERGKYSLDPITQPKTRIERENGYYPIQDPETGWWYPCNPDSVWRVSSEKIESTKKKLRSDTIEALIADNRISFSASECITFSSFKDLVQAIEEGSGPKDGNGRQLLRADLPDLDFWVGKPIGLGRPSRKAFWNEKKSFYKPVSSLMLGVNDALDPELHEVVSEKQGKATGEVQAIFGSKVFHFPKPTSLIKNLVNAAVGKDAIVLDFFAGSATTAQAVMELNAEDGGDRRFIMVSSTEATDDEPDKNLCRDVTAERVRRLNATDAERYADLAAGFAYLRTKQIDFEDLDYDLDPSDAWTCLEAFHGLSLTPYDADQPWNVHEGDGATLVLVDRFDLTLIEWLRSRTLQNVHVYAWAPGQITQHLDGMHIDVSPVRETLVKAFRA